MVKMLYKLRCCRHRVNGTWLLSVSHSSWTDKCLGVNLNIGPGDLGSIPGCVIPKTLKMVLDTSLLNIQQYKVRIKGSGAIQGKE